MTDEEKTQKNDLPDPLIKRKESDEVNQPRVISLISGKGGVGQTTLCANLGVFLAQSGHRVLLVDAVRWNQNVHTLLGMSAPSRSLDALVDGEVNDINELIAETPYQKLKLLCGIKESATSSAATHTPFLINEIRQLPFDFVLIDLGSHLTFNMLDHALWSDNTLLVAVPEPTAIESTYELLRALYFRLFKTLETKLGAEEIVEKAMLSSLELGIRTPKNLVGAIHFFKPEIGDRMAAEIARFRLKLILNQVRSNTEGEIGNGIISALRRYFGLEADFMGIVDYDSVVPAAVRQRKPLPVVQNDANATRQVEQLAHKLLSQKIKDKQDQSGS